ncbi:MAG: DUF3276 family protein [Bacteroidaceae bacterium]|nr:DUF3276 family protein [Bacteroidaceae bacterium]
MENEKDIVYSQSVKAGKRVYYLDVKRNKRDELFLCITESKRLVNGEGPDATFTFEKHKIFLYQEDFSKFIGALSNAIGYIHENQSADYTYPASMTSPTPTDAPEAEVDITLDDDLEIKIDFE